MTRETVAQTVLILLPNKTLEGNCFPLKGETLAFQPGSKLVTRATFQASPSATLEPYDFLIGNVPDTDILLQDEKATPVKRGFPNSVST